MVTPNFAPTTAWWEYGTNELYSGESARVFAGDGGSLGYVSIVVEGLNPSLTYHFRLVASNAMGFTRGADLQFGVARRVWVWGNQGIANGGTNVPPGLSNVVEVLGNSFRSYALTTDGKVVAWDQNVTSNLTEIAALFGPTTGGPPFALKTNGSLITWGGAASLTNIPAGLSNVVAVAPGDFHVLALKNDGTLAVWGEVGPPGKSFLDMNWGQTNIPGGLSNVVMIASGQKHSLALKDDGTVVAWGAGTNYSSEPNYGQALVPVGLRDVVAISAGGFQSMALRADGTVAGWGYDRYGQSTVPSGLSDVVRIYSGYRHSLALKKDGTVVAWGATGTLGVHPTYGQSYVPQGLSNVISISAGYYYTLASAPNQIPVALSQTVTGLAGHDLILTLAASDLDLDPLTVRVSGLPERGSLFQYNGQGRGAQIVSVDDVVSDPQKQVVFVPAAGEDGSPYASFYYVAEDGTGRSAPAMVSLTVMPQTRPRISVFKTGTNGNFHLGFLGDEQNAYFILGSTNLEQWIPMGAATHVSNGWFEFFDGSPSSPPQRFYRLRSP
jgi:hypothetical protein